MDQGPTEEFPLTGYVATQAWTAKYPRTAAAFTRALARGQQLAATSRLDVEKALIKYTTITKQTAAVMATGTFPQSVTTAALVRVAGLMQREYGFRPGVKVNVSHLAQEMTR
jgi:NitT/TauT family transport system substrate-binding protein